jgi:hypothetical protein
MRTEFKVTEPNQRELIGVIEGYLSKARITMRKLALKKPR